MADLTADGILSANDLPLTKLSIPEWGGDIYIRPMTGGQRDRMEDLAQRKTDARATIATWCACDGSGTLLFSAKDIKRLSEKNGKALDRILEAVTDVNNLSDKDIEELEKN